MRSAHTRAAATADTPTGPKLQRIAAKPKRYSHGTHAVLTRYSCGTRKALSAVLSSLSSSSLRLVPSSSAAVAVCGGVAR